MFLPRETTWKTPVITRELCGENASQLMFPARPPYFPGLRSQITVSWSGPNGHPCSYCTYGHILYRQGKANHRNQSRFSRARKLGLRLYSQNSISLKPTSDGDLTLLFLPGVFRSCQTLLCTPDITRATRSIRVFVYWVLECIVWSPPKVHCCSFIPESWRLPLSKFMLRKKRNAVFL